MCTSKLLAGVDYVQVNVLCAGKQECAGKILAGVCTVGMFYLSLKCFNVKVKTGVCRGKILAGVE